jgi:hypothetical protein
LEALANFENGVPLVEEGVHAGGVEVGALAFTQEGGGALELPGGL